MTSDTLYVSVNCCNEASRMGMWEKVSKNVLVQFKDHLDDLIIFDNASTHPAYSATIEKFKHVYRCDQNVGYWTALWWVLQNYETVMGRGYEFIHIIEPDRMYYDAVKLTEIEEFLKLNADVGAVKCHLYDVRDWRKYCKPRVDLVDYNEPGAVKTEWISHWNLILDKQVTLIHARDRFYLSNFHVQLHNLLRLDIMKQVFMGFVGLETFGEKDFMINYGHVNNVVAVYDGGIFESSLGLNEDAVACSTTPEKTLVKMGYKIAYKDRLLPDDAYVVSPVIRTVEE